MMKGFRQSETPLEQMLMWSQKLDDAVPADHPVRLVDAIFDSEVFADTLRSWRRQYCLVEGQPPYDPKHLVKLYVYGMMTGLRSSRQLETACYNRVDVIWLMSGQHPDHSTIAAFVSKGGKQMRGMFRDALRACRQAGLVECRHVCVDGTNIEADAGRGSVKTLKELEAESARVDEQIRELEGQWEANEKREESLFGQEAPWAPGRGKDMGKRMKELERKRAKLKAALAAIERRVEESPEGKQIAVSSDPDSRVMRDKEGRSKPNYNAQLAVDAQSGVIVACDVNDQANDAGLLTPMLSQIEENGLERTEEVSADSGYNTGADIEKLESDGIVGYLPECRTQVYEKATRDSREALKAAQTGEVLSEAQWAALPRDRGVVAKEAFRYDAGTDAYTCPAGQELRYCHDVKDTVRGRERIRRQYGGCRACRTCAHAVMCCKNPATGRTIKRDEYEPCRERMRQRMSSQEGRDRYRVRRQTVEPRFGHMKRVMGLRRFLRRGLAKVGVEWLLACLTWNVQKLMKCWKGVAMAQ
ncbi:MAG TPA: IS1182 family transposase [Verrucomicrobiota bacterium]|nr:IS1182 family transposase [Verrucomicrobiota bacterium]